MSEKQGLEVDNLFSQLCDSGRESIILRAEELNFGLEVSQPLLLPLSALEGSHPDEC
jgi:hypothetical protein